MQKQLSEQGYVILKNFFDPDIVTDIKTRAMDIFKLQFERFNYTGSFESCMKHLFNEQLETFINCGKIIQTGLIELYKIPVDNKLLEAVQNIGGLSFPNLCTRPVLFFNHPDLAKSEHYYKTPPHQDWLSMQASLDSVVVWLPLVDVNVNNGTLKIWPGSHLLGPLEYETVGGFAKVSGLKEDEFIQPELEVGDIVLFSSLLVHESGDILNDTIRWSCHFRYTNMDSEEFIDRGFPNPYIYKPEIQS